MKICTLFVVIGTLLMKYSLSEKCLSNQPVRSIIVVHRRINLSSAAGCYLSHSGLLLHLADGKSCVLEYATDGKAKLSQVNSLYYDPACFFKKCYIVDTYGTNNPVSWKTEKEMVPLSHVLGQVTPLSARDKMQDLMGNQYHLLKRNSNHAQQGLRKYWGLPVRDTFPNPSTVCSCITRTSSYLVPSKVRQIYQTTKEACRKHMK